MEAFKDFLAQLGEYLGGLLAAIIGYFLPIKDMVNFIILLFLIDVAVGYWTAKKIRGEKFNTQIVWQKTMPRMLISLLIIILTFKWDDTFKQDVLSTYNTVAWFISGILIISIAKNGYKLTRWEVFYQIIGIFKKGITERTGVDANEIDK